MSLTTRMLSASTMTAPRQKVYRRRQGNAIIALVVGFCVTIFGCAAQFEAQAATTERVVSNRFSGLAIEGFDPVAYFVDGRPVRGLADFEAARGGAVWRFHNEGNLASFLAHPEVYGPRFGGYDPIDLARGVTLAGNPLFWLISGERLYLFGVEANRDAFAADPERFLPQANLRWPELERGLSQ
jgi:hypothetical protein